MADHLPRFVRDGLRWARAETGRWPTGQTPEALAFQIALTMTEDWPVDVPLDRLTAQLIDSYSSTIALTIDLADKADF